MMNPLKLLDINWWKWNAPWWMGGPLGYAAWGVCVAVTVSMSVALLVFVIWLVAHK